MPFLGVLVGLQLIDPSVANTALVKAGQALEMQGATLALAASISTLAQAAPHAGLFLLGRAVAGIAAGAVLVLSFAAIGVVSRPDQLGKALGVWHLCTITSFIAASLMGGLLANSSWRLALGLVPLVALLCLPWLPVLLPPMPANAKLRPDWPGLISIAGAMVLFLSGVSHAVKGFGSPQFLVPTLSGMVLFGVHLLIERSRRVVISRSAPFNGGPSTRLHDSPLAEAAMAGHRTSAWRYGTRRLGAPQQTSNPGEAGAQLYGAAATQREGQG